MLDSLLVGVSNGNTMEFASDNSQGTQPRKKEEAGRLQRRLRGLKGLLTRDVTSCIDKKSTLNLNIRPTTQKLHLCRSTMSKTYWLA